VTRPAGTTRDWFRRFRPRPYASVRLLCFPHASGNATFYRDWAALLPDEIELVAVQYPGRLDRIGEPCLPDMTSMVEAISDVVRPVLQGPVALFGHSMGSAIAYEVAQRLRARYRIEPRALILSGRPAPRHHRAGHKHQGSDDLLWAELVRLNGTSPAALEHPELRAMLMSVLRGDYRLIETYRPRPAPPLSCPITALAGTHDPEARPAEIADWAEHTTGGFTLHTFEGDHFFLMPHRDEVLAAVSAAVCGPVRTAPPR
jgi:pyochelin biosynthesis protein PchC